MGYHKRHQRLMQELDIMNTRIRAHEVHMRKVKGHLPPIHWEDLVRTLKKLQERRREIHRKISELEG